MLAPWSMMQFESAAVAGNACFAGSCYSVVQGMSVVAGACAQERPAFVEQPRWQGDAKRGMLPGGVSGKLGNLSETLAEALVGL